MSRVIFKARTSFYALTFIGALVRNIAKPTSAPIKWHPEDPMFSAIAIIFCIGFILLTPPLFSIFISIIARNPYYDKPWYIPSNESNPFDLYNPLSFFHFAACGCIAAGVGFIAASPFTRIDPALEGIAPCILGVMILRVIRHAQKIAPARFTPTVC